MLKRKRKPHTGKKLRTTIPQGSEDRYGHNEQAGDWYRCLSTKVGCWERWEYYGLQSADEEDQLREVVYGKGECWLWYGSTCSHSHWWHTQERAQASTKSTRENKGWRRTAEQTEDSITKETSYGPQLLLYIVIFVYFRGCKERASSPK